MSLTFSAQDAEHLRATLQAIYSPLASPSIEAWFSVVNEQFAQLFQADAVVATFMSAHGSPTVCAVGLSDSYLAEYRDYWQFLDHTPAELQNRNLTVMSTRLLCEPYKDGLRPFHDSAIYQEYYKPHKIEDAVGLLVRPNVSSASMARESITSPLRAWGPLTLWWAAHRSRFGTELFGEKGELLVGILRPAVLSSLEAYFTMAGYRAALEQALDTMSEAVWLCNWSGELLHENVVMSTMLSAEPERARLTAALQHTLRSLILLHRDTGSTTISGLLENELPVVRTGRGAYRIRSSFVNGARCEQTSVPALILIVEKLSSEPTSIQDLMDRFELTRQEARVALLLADRRHNDEIAEALVISPNTARRHTQSVLAKLCISSRDDVALMLSMS